MRENVQSTNQNYYHHRSDGMAVGSKDGWRESERKTKRERERERERESALT